MRRFVEAGIARVSTARVTRRLMAPRARSTNVRWGPVVLRLVTDADYPPAGSKMSGRVERGTLIAVLEDPLAELLHMPASGITDDLTIYISATHVAAWDSLKHMEVVAALEQQFGCRFTFDEIVAFQSA